MIWEKPPWLTGLLLQFLVDTLNEYLPNNRMNLNAGVHWPVLDWMCQLAAPELCTLH